MVNTNRNHRLIISLSFALLIITALTSTIAHAANITVTTSRNPVALDDSFHLIYEADSNVDGEPDFNPIYEHFDVLNSAQSTNMRFINGSYSLKKTWDLSVIAKDIGKFTVPSIAFGKDTSPAIQITITNSTSPNSVAPGGQSTIPAQIFLESQLDTKQGWVQSQFIYTLRLLRTVSIAGASLTEPETNDPDAIIHALDENKYQTTRNGIRYEAFERRYAIFPQKSGTLKIKPATFEGRINSTQARTIFDQFRMSGQLKRLRSNAIEASVKSAPGNINLQDWLPAKNLQLVDEWSDDIANIKAGEPVTRTITIIAEGLTGVQLPDLTFTDIADLKQYPDKPVVENKQDNKGITGVKQIKIALIPAKAGNFILPELKLQWWNTKTGKMQTTSLPQTTLNVLANAQASTSSNVIIPPTPQPEIADNNLSIDQQPEGVEDLSGVIASTTDEPYWKWLSIGLAIAWLFTLLLLFKKKKQTTPKHTAPTQASSASIKTTANDVVKHSKTNDAKKTKKALIRWAKVTYGNNKITNLTQIAERCSPQLKHEIRQLNQSLYSTEHSSWNGETLLAAFKDENTHKSEKQDTHVTALKPLYNSK